MVLKRLQTEGTLSDKAYKLIKESILSLDLKPGEILLEDNLSEMLGISRTPIREALKKIQYEGLITYTPGKGTYVTELTIEQFLNIYPIRDSLEILSAKLSCVNRTSDNIKVFKDLLNKQMELMEEVKLDERAYLEIDRRLHVKIAQSTNNDILQRYLIQINQSYNRYLYFTEFEPRAEKVTGEHKELIDAIEDRDEVAVERIMKSHLLGVKDSIYSALINASKY